MTITTIRLVTLAIQHLHGLPTTSMKQQGIQDQTLKLTSKGNHGYKELSADISTTIYRKIGIE